MTDKCSACSNAQEMVSKYYFESALSMAERTIKRLWIVAIILIVVVIGTNAAWLYYESQWEVVETTETEIEQNTEGSGSNFIVGGDYNGKSENQGQENQE